MSPTPVSDAGDAGTVGVWWREHLATPFPAGLRGRVVAGEDVVLCDTLTAGCVSSFLAGAFDAEKRSTMHECLVALSKITAEVTDPTEAGYLDRLRRMAALVLATGTEATSTLWPTMPGLR
ncbi:hypothetical protein LX16_5073 [Stackebrandtia albiflava]|uniref:Uncharacterized protein n=1 Tax=Stackebrandtia albiflava TaxID=406432 RepID=A0A562UPQ0_9ACTN|nr:hypothetical protein [Stackebrandtia albiflava]TWJ07587.1 hypothetical protein LX16_5073 [Stackebrandtia albiflava]